MSTECCYSRDVCVRDSYNSDSNIQINLNKIVVKNIQQFYFDKHNNFQKNKKRPLETEDIVTMCKKMKFT